MENYGTNRMGGGHKLLQDRLKTEIETLKGISEPCRCGTTRQSYSAAYKEGTAYIKGVMEDCGLTVHEDGVGNVIGTLTGTEPGLAKILSGSNLAASAAHTTPAIPSKAPAHLTGLRESYAPLKRPDWSERAACLCATPSRFWV